MDNPVFDFWNKLMVNMWSKCATPAGSPFAWFTQLDRGKSQWLLPQKMAEAIADSFAGFTVDKKSGAGEVDSVAELMSNLMQTGFEGYIELQKRWIDGAKEGTSTFQDVESLSQAPSIWLDSIRKLLGLIPKVEAGGASGPSREVVVKYAAFSAKMSELLYRLCLPMDKASKAMVKKLEGAGRDGRLTQNYEEASGVWLSVLESSYLELLKSPNYTELLHETADAYEQYCQLRRQVYGPSAKAATKPQDRAVDELTDEMSKLREKLEELLKKVDSQTNPPPGPAE
ncbi:MAG: hypothetical protein ABSH41_29735 [Syntrophobacteraceae bacterium]|jgi:hypothetical protein